MIIVRIGVMPAISSGAIITIPSGIFCMEMPIVTAQSMLPDASWFIVTPAAIPSGSLWMAIAITKSSTPLSLWLLLCSSGSSPVIVCICGVKISSRLRKRAPATTPMLTQSHPSVMPESIVISKAGSISPTVQAESIMPAQKPRMVSFHLCGRSFIRNPNIAPTIVAPHNPAALSHTTFIICNFICRSILQSYLQF